MKKTSFHILRVGLAITFLWIAVLIFKEPEAWGAMLQPWAAGLLPIPIETAMIGTAVLDLLIGFLLLLDVWVLLAAILGSIHLLIIIITVGINPITVRDVGLLAGTLALLIDSLPADIIKKLRLNNQQNQNAN
ncbi:hypothetical protein A3A09_00285 [Candidatus Nomurabacteria bacterium RIFCSPLOWO2_01_FULL_42_20]|nr:MAG: hypothetical protein A3A09_00285 [Candidatus Nomurabacteria bacterium RIFCSPLOWO2_01_FULL_42_20]